MVVVKEVQVGFLVGMEVDLDVGVSFCSFIMRMV